MMPRIMRWKNFEGMALWGVLALVPVGCGGDDSPSSGETDTEGADESTGGQTSNASNTNTSAGSADSGTSTTTSAGSTTNDDGSFINDDGDTGEPTPQPNGAQCTSNDGCTSGFCYTVPMLGGVCSECLMDSDCGSGTCSLDINMGYAVCTDGSLGKMCDSDDGCMGDLVCAQLIDTGGFFPANFCSECNADADCEQGQFCSPHYDASGFTGHLRCVDPGSVPDGEGCPIENGTGNGEVCEHGHCGVADVFMGFVQLGVCGECSTDDDCPDNGTCEPASVSQTGLQGATCSN